MNFNVAAPKVSVRVDGDKFVAVVSYPSGLFRGRPNSVGPARDSIADAVAAALAVAAPVIADIIDDSKYADMDD